MMGKLHLDMCFQQRHLISGVDVKLRLIRAKDTFCLVGDGQYKVTLKDVAVFCRNVRPSDAVRFAHIKALQKSTAKNLLRRVEVKSFTLPRANLSWTKESVFLGQLPKRLIVGFVDNDAYNGSFQKHLFNFKHYDINYLSLVKDGEQIFSKALQPHFDNKNFVRSCLSLFTETNQYYTDEGNSISRSDYGGGHTLFPFDLTPDLGSAADQWELVSHGNLCLEVRFGTASTTTINAIVYAEFENLLEITATKYIIFDYAA